MRRKPTSTRVRISSLKLTGSLTRKNTDNFQFTKIKVSKPQLLCEVVQFECRDLIGYNISYKERKRFQT